MAELIVLSNEQWAAVDTVDYAWAIQFTWHMTSTGYAYRQERKPNGKLRTIRMHRELLQAPKGMDVDHINGDRLDNRRVNLRLATRSQNLKNKTRRRSDNNSGVTGVFRHSDGKKWTAQIHVDRKAKHLGQFEHFEDAVKARRAAEILHYGEFAPRNENGTTPQRTPQ